MEGETLLGSFLNTFSHTVFSASDKIKVGLSPSKKIVLFASIKTLLKR